MWSNDEHRSMLMLDHCSVEQEMRAHFLYWSLKHYEVCALQAHARKHTDSYSMNTRTHKILAHIGPMK